MSPFPKCVAFLMLINFNFRNSDTEVEEGLGNFSKATYT